MQSWVSYFVMDITILNTQYAWDMFSSFTHIHGTFLSVDILLENGFDKLHRNFFILDFMRN